MDNLVNIIGLNGLNLRIHGVGGTSLPVIGMSLYHRGLFQWLAPSCQELRYLRLRSSFAILDIKFFLNI